MFRCPLDGHLTSVLRAGGCSCELHRGFQTHICTLISVYSIWNGHKYSSAVLREHVLAVFFLEDLVALGGFEAIQVLGIFDEAAYCMQISQK